MNLKNLLSTLCLLLCLSGCKTPSYPFANAPEPIDPVHICNENVHVALVLGGGGARGMFHVGVLEALEEANIPLDMIVGCSAGSIVGALYADRPDACTIRDLLIRLKRTDLIDLDIFNCCYGLCHGHELIAFMKRHLKCERFEDLKIPFMVVTTDLRTGELITLGTGPIVPAVHASCCVPFFFRPVRLYGRVLVDGGIIDPNPVQVAKQYNPRIIIAVDLSEMLPRTAPTNLFGIATRCYEISYYKHSQHCLLNADVVIRPDLEPIGMFDDKHARQLYEAGKEAGRLAIPKIKELYEERVLKNS